MGAAPAGSRIGRPPFDAQPGYSAAENAGATAAGTFPGATESAGATAAETFPVEEPARELCRIVLDGRELDAECLRGELPAGTRVRGPAICALPESTLLVPPGWEGEVDVFGTMCLLDAKGEP